MHEYSITIARSARKELENLPAEVVERIFPRIESLVDNPRPIGCKKIKGEETLWRIRVGDYRIVYHIYEKQRHIDVTGVRHRKDAYR